MRPEETEHQYLIRRTGKALATAYQGLADEEISDGETCVEVLITFNHDWERHVLVQSTLVHDGWWTCSLWHLWKGDEGWVPTLVKAYENRDRCNSLPLISVASIVGTWQAHQHYGGISVQSVFLDQE